MQNTVYKWTGVWDVSVLLTLPLQISCDSPGFHNMSSSVSGGTFNEARVNFGRFLPPG